MLAPTAISRYTSAGSIRENALRNMAIFFLAVASLFLCRPVRSQELVGDSRPRFLLDSEIGSANALGYSFPSLTIGPALEIPVRNRFEIQTAANYSPDNKRITKDGQLAKFRGSFVTFANERIGFVGTLERAWLWTSQFDKVAWYPSAGIVLRNDYFGPGRFYATYVFPTGCVWATSNNPCAIQSNRLQGVAIRQEIRSFAHARYGFESGVYHFCDQANPDNPETGRNCHWGPTMLVFLRFEFHLGNRPLMASAMDSDNF